MELNLLNRLSRWLAAILHLSKRILDIIFFFPTDRLGRFLSGVGILGLFAFGIYLWGIFFSWGNIPFDFLDWGEVTGPRYALLRDAAEKGILPLHVGNTTALRGVTDRYFSIADTPFSPQYLLLPSLETGQYIFYDVLLHYSLGFLGLVLLFRKYRLSLSSFSLIFLLFNFNGHITIHLAVGHSNWVGYFLLPFYILLVLDLVEKERASWRWILGFSLVMLAILLQGHFHLWLWCLMFLVPLALLNWRLIRPVLLAGVFTGLVCLPRLLPPTLALDGVTQEYLGGFASLTDLAGSLIVLNDPLSALHEMTDTFPLNPWETDFYIGLLGFALVVGFGIWLPLRRERARKSMQVQILVACLVLAAFSIGEVFAQVVRVFTFPPLTGERVTSRMLILPLVMILTLAAIFAQRELARRKPEAWVQILILISGGILFHDLNQHLQTWSVRYLDPMVYLYPKIPFDPAQHTIVNRPDPVYVIMLLGGGAVAVLALVFLIWMAAREGRHTANRQPAGLDG